jgi:hypothetical protein
MPRALSPPNKKFLKTESSTKTDLKEEEGEEIFVQLSQHVLHQRKQKEELGMTRTVLASVPAHHQLGEPKHSNFSKNLNSRNLTGGEVKENSPRNGSSNGSDRLFGDLNGPEEDQQGLTRLVVRLWEDNLGETR